MSPNAPDSSLRSKRIAGRVLASAELKKFLALLRAKPFRTVLASLPGYDNAITGRVMEVEEGLAGPRPARIAVPG